LHFNDLENSQEVMNRKQQDKLVITLNREKREYQKKEDVTFISIFVVGCHIYSFTKKLLGIILL